MKQYSAPRDLRHSLRLAQLFQVAWLLSAVILLWLGAEVKLILLFVLLLTAWVPALVEFITRTKLPTSLQLHYLLFITASSVVGSAFGMYGTFLSWDTLVHIDSGVLLAWLGFFAVKAVEVRAKIRIPRWFAVATALAVPLAFSALWEIYEYTSDRLFGTAMQPNLEDTIIDMIAGLAGAVLGVVLVRVMKAPKAIIPSMKR